MSELLPAGWGRRGEMQGYIKAIDYLKDLSEGVLPKRMRRFDIRLRLALSKQISFDSNFSYTKSESVRKTYKALIELSDLWFAYEGIFSLCKEKGISEAAAKISNPFSAEVAERIGLGDILKLLMPRYRDELLTKQARRDDYAGYIEYLKASAQGRTQLELLGRLADKTMASELPEFNTWMALIYAIRNLYVHDTDTAKSGVTSYATKIAVLSVSHDFLVGCLLAISEYILDSEIAEKLE